ncbi:hypothetical protein RclHR1_38320001 [Rhizophagus clarus]|uniref:Uncharacterized protein n=1 Tax=Rhizophagus clarus TaxID=94130 RepID=A0A2Z6RH27_9GLOM|nr:hypothetical protein RclHR1_38320001 [Rhizophagus clarus]
MGDPAVDDLSCGMQNLVNSGDSHPVPPLIIPELGISQPGASSKSPITPKMRPLIADTKLIDVNIENANDDTTMPPHPSGSSNITPKIKRKKSL